VYRATISLPTDRIAAAAAGRPGFAIWTSVNVRLTLVRTFAQGAWVQVVPGPMPRRRGGTLARPDTAESRTEVYGLFTPAQGERWLGWRGPGDLRPVPILRIVEQARLRAQDPSTPVAHVPVRLDIDPGDCSGWTLMTATGDVAYDDVRRDVGRTRTGVAVPPGTTWYVRAPSLENTSWPPDTVHTFGPFVAPDEPFALTGAFSCRRPSGDITMSTGSAIQEDVELLRCLPTRSGDGRPCAS
jgi:hypothetical protein